MNRAGKKVQVIGPAVEGHEELLVGCKLAEIPQHRPSSEKSRAKSWQVTNEPASNHPSPMRKGKVPVPPAKARGLGIEEQAVS